MKIKAIAALMCLSAAVISAALAQPSSAAKAIETTTHKIDIDIPARGKPQRVFFSLFPIKHDNYILCRQWVTERHRVPNGSHPSIDYSGYAGRAGTNPGRIEWQAWVDPHHRPFGGGTRRLHADFGATWIWPSYSPEEWVENGCTGKLPPVQEDHEAKYNNGHDDNNGGGDTAPPSEPYFVGTELTCMRDTCNLRNEEHCRRRYVKEQRSKVSCADARQTLDAAMSRQNYCQIDDAGNRYPDHIESSRRLQSSSCPGY